MINQKEINDCLIKRFDLLTQFIDVSKRVNPLADQDEIKKLFIDTAGGDVCMSQKDFDTFFHYAWLRFHENN